ncbi:MAG: SLC13 family permease, partial [Microcystis panniformis]
MLESLPMWIAAMTFIAVIVVIMFEWLHITVAALLGALILVFTHIMTLQEAVGYISRSYATLALFFGVMVLVRAFEPTKIFDPIFTLGFSIQLKVCSKNVQQTHRKYGYLRKIL